MNRNEMLAARDAYLAKLKEELKDKFPEALEFYNNEENFTTSETPEWPKNKNSRKGLTSSKNVLSDAELRHLLRRVFQGYSKETFLHFQGKTRAEVVAELTTEEELAEPVNDYSYNDPDVAFGASFANAPWSQDFTGDRVISLKSWFVDQMRTASTSMHSTMWLFWHNHLVTGLWAVFNGRMSYQYLKLLHDLSFGDFKELMYRITVDPAMLIYLNGIVNNVDAPDENYGRELQELFTIGKGPDAGYTETDVQQAARILTGWNLDWGGTEETVFNPVLC